MTQQRFNPVLEANAAAWERFVEEQIAPNDRELFDSGWEAALEFTAPIIQAAVQTWRLIEMGTDAGVSVEGLGGAGQRALLAATNWLAVVRPGATGESAP